MSARGELPGVLRRCRHWAGRSGKSLILDELASVTGCQEAPEPAGSIDVNHSKPGSVAAISDCARQSGNKTSRARDPAGSSASRETGPGPTPRSAARPGLRPWPSILPKSTIPRGAGLTVHRNPEKQRPCSRSRRPFHFLSAKLQVTTRPGRSVGLTSRDVIRQPKHVGSKGTAQRNALTSRLCQIFNGSLNRGEYACRSVSSRRTRRVHASRA